MVGQRALVPRTSSSRPSVSVIVPAFNEAACVGELARRLARVFDEENTYVWEAIIIENGSTDGTWEELKRIHSSDPRFKVVRLARNFRMDGGITAGLDYATGDACVLMTADLQDPPEVIPSFLRMWERGYQNVYAIVTKRIGTGPIRRLNSAAFYWVAGKLTDGRIPRNASDFRLLDRKVYEAVRSMGERNRFVRGLVAWVGFESVGIPVERPKRFAGESNAHSMKVVELAFKGIFAHSYKPLRLITIVGVLLSLVSFVSLACMIILWITSGVPFAGFGTLVTLFILLFGVLAFMIGIVSEYVGLIYEEVKARPNFVVASTLGFNDG